MICLRGLCATAAAAAVDMVLCVSTARSSSRHPTGAVARVDWLMDARARADINTTITVSARACMSLHTLLALAMLLMRDARLPQDAGGTWRDLIIGCAVLEA